MLVPQDSGKPEGMVIPFVYPNQTGWVAFFIMSAAYRKQGLGRELWKEMEIIIRSGNPKFFGLDGVPEQVKTYERRGFKDCARIPLMVRDSLKKLPLPVHNLSGTVELKSLKEIDPKEVARLDLEHTGLDRSVYWASEALLSRPNTYGFAISSDSRITGFVYVRQCQLGYRVGPLIAQTYAQGKQLLQAAMKEVADADGSFIAEAFGTNPNGRKLFEELGWTYADISYHRMWLNGDVPTEQLEGGAGPKGMYAIFDACAG